MVLRFFCQQWHSGWSRFAKTSTLWIPVCFLCREMGRGEEGRGRAFLYIPMLQVSKITQKLQENRKTQYLFLDGLHFFSFDNLSTCWFTKQMSQGAIHSTKISGLRFEIFLGANGSRQVRKVSFHSTLKKGFALIQNGGCWIAVAHVRVKRQIPLYQWYCASCFICSNLNCSTDYIEQTVSRYLLVYKLKDLQTPLLNNEKNIRKSLEK